MLKLDPACYPRISRASVELYRGRGEWRNRTVADDLIDTAAQEPERILFHDEASHLTSTALLANVRALAQTLLGWGVRPQDVVSFQLPNWLEAVVVDVACAMIGAISNPISIIYRNAELRGILAAAQTRVVFLPGLYKGRDFAAEVAGLGPQLPHLERIVTVRDARSPGAGRYARFEDALSHRPDQAIAFPRTRPESIKALMFTSGTTGYAKGVLHTHETSARTIHSFVDGLGVGPSDILFMPSTLTHATGYAYGIQMPLIHRTATVFMDGWDARRAHALIEQHRATITAGAVPFLMDLSDIVAETGRQLSSVRYFGCGGGAVTPTVIGNGVAAFGRAKIFRLYGSTETGNVTCGYIGTGEEALAAETDGRIVDCAVRLAPVEGGHSIAGAGEILVRGPATFAGYINPRDNNDAFTDDGFFRTGDIGVLGEQGSLTIVGRLKDIIIRGGYNISAKEVEDHINCHALVREVAVVGEPHPRLGETICAFIIPTDPAAAPTLGDIATFLEARGLAKQKLPERVIITETLPRTPAGKIKKFLLKQQMSGE